MSNTGNFFLNGLVGVAITAVVGATGRGCYRNKERPLPVSFRSYDNGGVQGDTEKKDGKLNPAECMAVVADLVDVNHDGQIDDNELNTKSKQVVGELRDALGRSNFDSAAQLESTIQTVYDAPKVLAEWQAAVNRARLNK